MKNIKYVVFLVAILLFLYAVNRSADSNNKKVINKLIEDSFEGEVIKVFSSRKGLPPMFILIKTEKGEVSISVESEVIDAVAPGDSIKKIKGENILQIRKKADSERFEFMYWPNR